MCQLDRLQHLKTEIYQIAERHNADEVYVFGSCARKAETPESDVELLVNFTPQATLFDQVHSQDEIEALLNARPMWFPGVVCIRTIQKDILAEAVLL